MKVITTSLIFIVSSVFVTRLQAQEKSFHWFRLTEESNRLEGKYTGLVYHYNASAFNNFFLYSDWVDADVIFEDGDTMKNLQVRYDIKNDELVVYNRNINILFSLDKEKVKGFTLNLKNEKQEFIKLYYEGMVSGYKYFRQLYKGTRSLIALHNVKEIKVAPFTDSNGILNDKEYKPDINYYIFSEKSGFNRLLTSKNSFLIIFPKNKNEIRRIFRKNKIKQLDEPEIVRTIQLLDEEGILD